MKYDPKEDWRTKMRKLGRLIDEVKSRRDGPPASRPLSPDALARVEDVTRFEQFKGQVYKQCGNRQRDFSAR